MSNAKGTGKAKGAGSHAFWLLLGMTAISFTLYETGDWGSFLYLCPVWLLFLTCMNGKRREKQQLEFYSQLEEFIGNLQMYYGYFQDMEEAVYEAAVLSKKRVFFLGKWLQVNLRNFQAGKEETKLFRDIRPDGEQRAYVQLLFATCKAGVMGEENSLALEEALRRVKEEIREKCRELKRIREGFTGLLEICLLTSFALPFARAWGSSNLEELKSWYEGGSAKICLIFCLVLSMGLYLLLAKLRFKGSVVFGKDGDERESEQKGQRNMAEILRFYDWILLKKENPSGSTEDILQELIPLATGRRKRIERLFYDYMQYGTESLERARDGEESIAFARILEGLLRCDQVDLKTAFGSFETERAYYLEQLREEGKKAVKEQVALGRVLAFVPLYGVTLFFLIGPFVMRGLAMLEEYGTMLGG